MSKSYPYRIGRGKSYPQGATLKPDGVNFSLYAPSATGVDLMLFEEADDHKSSQLIRLETRHHRGHTYWHVFVHGLKAGQLYGYRVSGPHQPEHGLRFDDSKLLVDPYALKVVRGLDYNRGRATREGDNAGNAFKSVVVDPDAYDWEGVEPPDVDRTLRVVYEMHVRGFTQSPTSDVANRGTFAGVIEKLDYLEALGINVLELLPVYQFDDSEVPFRNPETGKRHIDFWGYNPVCYFAPHDNYCSSDAASHPTTDGASFQDLVKECHRRGMELWLDVVYNHTSEGNENGPWLSMRGIDNRAYYMMSSTDRRYYADYTGCGNTLNCNHPAVQRLVLDSLRHWVTKMGVDGFRFDLASAMTRDMDGQPMENPPVCWAIETDPELQRAAMIAEPWDPGGLYQVGRFPGERWGEWNGKYRDDLRSFLRGDPGYAAAMASRLTGSPDLYEPGRRFPSQSVNFITCHDGFTLNDLVSYNEKHNMANGENGRDGENHNISYNYGVEGPTDDPEIETTRNRQVKNAIGILLLSQGTPMLLAGDEFRRTQHGNNNAWCQDTPLSWIDWTALDEHQDVFRFTQSLIAFRKAHGNLHRSRYLLGMDAPVTSDIPGYPRLRWHGLRPDHPDWRRVCRFVSFTVTAGRQDVAIHVAINMASRSALQRLPAPRRGWVWKVAVDTMRPSPEDVFAPGDEPVWTRKTYEVGARSIVVLIEGTDFEE
ncbi:MAG: isoamylase [Myxococcota bacterium]